MAILFPNSTRMRSPFRATVLVGLLALVTLFSKPVQAAGPTTKIALVPASATITADQTQTFAVMAVAADGTQTDVTSQSTLSSNDPSGSVSGAIYTPGKVGVWNIQAVYQSFTTTAPVTVSAGAPAEIVINPNSEPEQAYIGTIVKFSATVYDGKNNIVTEQKITWSVIGENGTIDSQGVFTPKKVGTSKVQAAVGSVIGQASVVVSPAIVTNTNTTNTNTVKNVNSTKNTNATKNINATNTNSTTPTTAAGTSTTTQSTTTSCTTLKPWVWILILIAFLIAVAILLALVPVTAVWPVAVALVGAAILAFVQRKYDCNGQAWWAWVIMLGTIALAAAALMMRPKSTPLTPGA